MKLIITLMFLTTYAHAANCKKHPIYCQIKKNTPSMSKSKAMKLSNVIYKAARKHKIPANIYTAILRQESNYRLEAQGCHSGLRPLTPEEKEPLLDKCLEDRHIKPKGYSVSQCVLRLRTHTVESRICTDFGMSQIYFKTARRFGFDIEKLNDDLTYSVEAGAIVLSGFKKRYSKKGKDWWTRYNCGSRSTTKRDTCQIYKKLVERYL